MKQKILCLVIALLIILGSLCSCSPKNEKNKYTTDSMEYFDTVITIIGYANSQEEFDEISNDILAQFAEYHKLYSIYDKFEEIENLYTINELVGGKHRTVEVDQRIIDLLLFAKEMYAKTNGIMNVAMGSVLSEWHKCRINGIENPEKAVLPDIKSLKDASKHTDISKMIIDDAQNTVTLTDPEMSLDIGAIAKGYATERIAKELEKSGVTGYLLNVGGNVRTIGNKADGTKWTVGIENPNGNDYLAYLKLNGESVVTSGSYQRFYYVDGKPYHHIINPNTLMPAAYYLSVSIICDDSGLADALSTALFCMPQSDGLSLIKSLDGVEAMWVDKNGKKTFSPDWKDLEK
ncbi:MAG: FAD:protein FMN transferase [Clostridia bacterium]|nr:FAD:protein FMN transferase [Clostridia bacterium]